jgi:hypothetical protein
MREGLLLHVLSSLTAGLATALITSPVDVMKTRIMNQVSVSDRANTCVRLTLSFLQRPEVEAGSRYTGLVDCFVKTVKAEVRSPLGVA